MVAAVRRLSVAAGAADPNFLWCICCNPLFASAATSGSADLGSAARVARSISCQTCSKSQLLTLHFLQSSLLDII